MNDEETVGNTKGICEAFEHAWQSRNVPDVQQWLDRVPSSQWPQLLPGLIRIDLEYRLKDGTSKDSLQDYVTRYGVNVGGISLRKSSHASSISKTEALTTELPSAAAPKLKSANSDDVARPESNTPMTIGKFQLMSAVGRGGFGVVYKAFDTVLKRVVALKIPRDPLTGAARTRFLREAEASAGLDHPGLVPVFEAGESEDGPCYIATAFCDGPNLATWLQNNGRPAWRDAAAFVRDMAEAMQHAHNRGVVHRDLKPANVMVVDATPKTESESTSDASAVSLRITDFGLAKFVADRLQETQTSVILGTPNYMAPEQIDSQISSEILAATDIYGLGVILYELLTGERPFDRETVIEVMDAIRHEKVQHLKDHDSDVPEDLETVCLKCLSKDPAERYESCSELAQDLSNFIQGKSIVACRPGVAEKLKLWLRSPARLQETGLLSILLGIGVPAWIVLIIVFVSSEGLDAEIKSELVPQTLGVTILLLLPTAWIGFKVLDQGIQWAKIGLTVSVVNLLMVSPPLFGYTMVFPELYSRYPLGKIVAYTFLTATFAIQVLQYINALRVAPGRATMTRHTLRPHAAR